MALFTATILLLVNGVAPLQNANRFGQIKWQKGFSAAPQHPRTMETLPSFRNPRGFIQQLTGRHKPTLLSGKFFLEEFPFDTTRLWGTAPGEQSFPDIGFDGTNYLVVWMDDRTYQSSQIYGARLTPDGVLLDSTGIPISTGDGDRLYPAVAFDGTNYLVVWMDDRDNNWEFEIYGTRVTPQGRVLDTAGIPISTGSGDRAFPAVAFDGTNYLVVWMDDRDGDERYDIYGARVTPRGQVLEPAGIPICTDLYQQMSYRGLIYTGSNYLCVWMDGRDENDEYPNIYGARIRPDGVVLDTNGRPLIQQPDNQTFPRLASSGANHFLVWNDDRAGETYIYGCRLNPDGVPIDTGGFPIAENYYLYPAIAFDGSNYLMVYLDENGSVAGMRLTPDGTVIDTGGFIINQNYCYYPPEVKFAAGQFLVGFTPINPTGGDEDVAASRVTPGAVVLDPEGIALAYGWRTIEQDCPVAAFNGTDYLIVWQDRRQPWTHIYGTRMTTTGEILDPGGIKITGGELYQISPAIASDSNNYLVVWVDYRPDLAAIFGSRVTRDGVVLDSNGIQISSPESTALVDYPAIAFDGTNYLTIWQSFDLATGNYKLAGSFVTPAGQVPGEFSIASSDSGISFTGITFGRENYLVVWSELRNGRFNLYASRITRDGTVLDPQGIPVDTTAGFDKFSPAVAFDGDNYLVVYSRTDFVTCDIYGKRINQSGVVLDSLPIAIVTAEESQWGAAVAFAGTKYLVVWNDNRTFPSAIYGARVLPGGMVIDTNGILLLEDRTEPKITTGRTQSHIQFLLTFYGYYYPQSTTKALGAFYLDPIGIAETRPGTNRLTWRLLPNPVRDRGVIQLSLSLEEKVEINLYAADGRLLKNILNRKMKTGNHTVPIETKNLPAGVYFIKIKSENETTSAKMLLVND